jgi:hypothetical protein
MHFSLKLGLVRHAATVAALVALGLLVGCVSFGAVAFALPPGRHYEMASPVHKGGFGATQIGAVAPNGESVGYYSAGIFNGNTTPTGSLNRFNYLAIRGASGWETIPTGAPASLLAGPFLDFSADLSTEFASGSPGPDVHSPAVEELGLWLHPTDLPDTPAEWQQVDELEVGGASLPPEADYLTADGDFCHPLFEGTGKTLQLYEADRGCDGEPEAVVLVGVNNRDKIIHSGCEVSLGDRGYTLVGPGSYNAINTDGSEVFFTDCLHGITESSSPHQLFVRVGGSRTLEVSRPLEAGPYGGCVGEVEGAPTPGEVPCAGVATRASADFMGASEDGSKVYFTTSAQLTATDNDTSNDLYLATIGCPQASPGCGAGELEVTSLTQVSHDPGGGAAEVQGVVRVAPDGQRVYFVARGDLLSGTQRQALEGEGRPVPAAGANNLYVYDSAAGGSMAFVADLCSGTELSGTVEDPRCPSGEADAKLWTSGNSGLAEAQTAGPGGEFLVFATHAQLTSDDTNAAKDIYRYDAETGVVSRVSIGEDGYEPNGSHGVLGAKIAAGNWGGRVFEQYEMDVRAISEDGSRIVFTSAEPLSVDATNGLVNAYEWHAGPGSGGSVALVSTGSDREGVEHVVISANGLSVFFVTVQGLAAQDNDGAADVYDARLGEDFPAVPGERQPCEGDGCQGPLTNPAPLLVAGSVSQAPGDNFAPTAAAGVPASSKAKGKPKPTKCRHGYTRKKSEGCVKVRRKARKATARRRGNGSITGGRS